ncbi:hypothetical protein [Rhizobium sp. GCM10022189]|uniref:hypothetical protein n=1 Tax=Rhizobium sp. GCM10022189 TaxID=3252654 RepID=UPI003611BB10
MAQEDSARRIIKADAILPVVVMCEIPFLNQPERRMPPGRDNAFVSEKFTG